MTHLWIHRLEPVWELLVVSAIILLHSQSASAVELDLTGKTFTNGGKFVVSSTASVAPSMLYDVRLEASGTGTGTFASVFGSGDLATRLEQIQPGSSHDLRITLANLSGKLPVLLGQTTAFQQLGNVPVSGTGVGDFISKGKIKAQITKEGIVKATAKGMKFTAHDHDQTKVSVTGAYTVDAGRLVVEPSPATSTTPRPDLILLLNTRFTIGNDEYDTTAPGVVDVVPLKRGRTKTDYFIVQNDGPAADSLVLRSLFSPPGLSLRVFEGKSEITDQVASQKGYLIENLPSAGTKLFRMSVKLESDAALRGTLTAGVRVSRSADASVSDTGGISVFVR